MRTLGRPLHASPFLLAAAVVLTAGLAAAAPKKSIVEPRLSLASSLRHPELSSRSSTMPVVVELDAAPTPAQLAAIEATGARVVRTDRGDVMNREQRVPVEVPPAALAALSALPGVRGVRFDGPPVRTPRPLDLTANLISADATWRSRVGEGPLLTGAGVTICDIDNGVDVAHPMFFRADGGAFAWIDTDENGTFEFGVDAVDLGDGPVTLKMLNGVVWDRYTGDPLFDTDSETFNPSHDYIYADLDGDGERNYGTAAGFTEADPGYGEPMFALDDVDDSGTLDVGEKLFLLKTSKVKAFRIDTQVYRRGENLIDAPWTDEMLHGVGSSGVMVAGQPGFSDLVGMAPDADLVLATDNEGYRQFQMMQFCATEDARVVLHEYAPWAGYHLDGSSDVEQLIDSQSAEGIVHINPAGNLSTSQKLFKKSVAAGATTTIPIEIPDLGASVMVFSLLWRDDTRDLDLTLRSPSGVSFTMPLDNPQGFQTEFAPGLDIAGYRQDSTRGTAMVLFYLFTPDGPPDAIPAGAWSLDVVEPVVTKNAPLQLFAYVLDEVSGWAKGINFPEDWSEDHLIGWPGTADHGLAVAAFTGHPFNDATTGERAFYSGRGRRIDDEPILWISAPDNPIVPGRYADKDLSYMVYGGTSGASPHVAGASALIVQSNPELTGDQVKELIRASAVQDDATGAVPNEDFGHGKLDVYRAIFDEAAPGGDAPVVDNQAFTVTVGSADPVSVVATDADGDAIVLEVDRDYDGAYDETLADGALVVETTEAGVQIVKVRATDTTGRTDEALVEITAEPLGPGDDGGDLTGEDEDEGCDCSAPGSRVGGALPIGALLLGFALRRRRRAR